MDREIVGKKPTFHRNKQRLNTYRVMLWLILIMGALWLLRGVQNGEIKPLFRPTPTPTRVANSYIQEADTYFQAGKIDDPTTDEDAIGTYQLALKVDPNNADVWAKLARIQTYSSVLLSTRDQKVTRLKDALTSIDKAVALNPDSSNIHAIRAFVLDWNASYQQQKEKQRSLTDAMDESTRALQLDPNDAMALAYYAEVQLDQQKWSEAKRYAEKAIEQDPNSMDAHRVYATVLEYLGNYRQAIEEYTKAASITPNLTFLYINIGQNYRILQAFDKARENFEKAVKINEQIDVKDPLPYVALANTYSQEGEFFIAARNAEKALTFNPTEANTYGALGIIYFKARNYESSLPALQCAVVGCSADENLVLKQVAEQNPNWNAEPVAVQPLKLENLEVAYYYAEYVQVLAYLSRPKENLCARAYPVMQQLRDQYPDDAVLMQIVLESNNICRRLEGEIIP